MKKLIYLSIFISLVSCSTFENIDYTIIEEHKSLNEEEAILNSNLSNSEKEIIIQDYITLKENKINIENVKEKKYNLDNIRVKLTVLEKNKLIFNIYDSNNNYKVIEVEAINYKLLINNEEFDEYNIKNYKGVINVLNYTYYGDMYLKAENSKIKVINILDMERYLLGVLPFEIPNSFPLEALKAQAIIARSYAYKNISRKRKDYDLDDTIKFQVYQGIPKKNIDNIKQAINETKSMVITHKGKIIDALFHSYSGGHTASAKEVYGNDFEYLKAVEDKFSNYIPDNILNWEYIIDKDILFNELGFEVENFDISYTESNRVEKIILYNNDKTKFKIYTGNEFRRKFSIIDIKSTYYTIDLIDKGIKVKGSGFGHGVGFSQWSSKSMVIDYNMNYLDIINYFYKNVEVVKKGE